jgi:hypothetical protein
MKATKVESQTIRVIFLFRRAINWWSFGTNANIADYNTYWQVEGMRERLIPIFER